MCSYNREHVIALIDPEMCINCGKYIIICRHTLLFFFKDISTNTRDCVMRFSSWVTHGIYKQAKIFCDIANFACPRIRWQCPSCQLSSYPFIQRRRRHRCLRSWRNTRHKYLWHRNSFKLVAYRGPVKVILNIKKGSNSHEKVFVCSVL